MSPRIVNWIYTAVDMPFLLYGVALWWSALHKQCILTPLNKVQRMAALCISGALRITPKEALNAILNLHSLDKHEMVEIGSHLTEGSGRHDKSISKKTELCKSFPDREEWEQGRPGTTDVICFYTDGSKLEGIVGGGVYSEQLNIRKSFRLPSSKRRSTL